MKKIGKIKLIEAGRMNVIEETKSLRGGCASHVTGCNNYRECFILGGYTNCVPSAAAAYGYEVGGDGTIYCNIGYAYSSTGVEMCGGDRLYKSR